MKTIRYLINAFKTRNWFSIVVNPKELFLDNWYTVSVNIMVDSQGNQYYEDLILMKTKITNFKAWSRPLKKRELIEYYKLNNLYAEK